MTVGSCNLQPDTPFLDRLGFGGGTARRGSCACVREPLWGFRQENPKKTKTKKKHRGAILEISRHQTKQTMRSQSGEQFKNDNQRAADSENKWK